MYILKRHNENIDNRSIRIYASKIKNKVAFKIKRGYYLALSTMSETMKLLWSTENKITKDKGENVPHAEITKVLLVSPL